MMTPLTGVTPIDTARPGPQGVGAAAGAGGESFGNVMAGIASVARDSLKTGEATAIAGVSGDTSVQNVVRAMMTAEQQLRAAVAIRDRVVAAYQEIARMQI